MRNFNTILVCMVMALNVYGQTSTGPVSGSSVNDSQGVRDDRDVRLNELNSRLQENEILIQQLRSQLPNANQAERIRTLQDLQIASESRLDILEQAPKIKIEYNGKVALIELLSLQRDLKPADLFMSSNAFFMELGNIGDIRKYNEFTTWKSEYDRWYERKKGNDQVIDVVNNSLNLITNATNKVPLYGSIVSTVTSGLTLFIDKFSRGDRALKERTIAMQQLFNVVSQFEDQKAVIDNEWKQITSELNSLKGEYTKLKDSQFQFYSLSNDVYVNYSLASTETDRDNAKRYFTQAITEKIRTLNDNIATSKKWPNDVETYMYKVQALRMKFGNLTLRMLANIKQYYELINIYKRNDFPSPFVAKLENLTTSLGIVERNFSDTFLSSKYIEDSVTMYLNTPN